MKLLYKLLGISEYIEELKGIIKLQDKQIKELTTEANTFSERYSSAYQTNTDLTNELNKLRQQITNQNRLETKLTEAEYLVDKQGETIEDLSRKLSAYENTVSTLEKELYNKDIKLNELKCFVIDKINKLAKDLHNYD